MYDVEYQQALAFDQLYNLMRNGQAFVGFREAAINFPPTFKYDVLRTLKSKRSKRPPKRNNSKLNLNIVEGAAVVTQPVPEDAPLGEVGSEKKQTEDVVDEKGHGDSSDGGSGDEGDDADDGATRREGEVYSVMSKSSNNTRGDADQDHEDEDSDDDDDPTTPLHTNHNSKSPKVPGAKRLVAKLSLHGAAHKAKLKWNVFVSSNASMQALHNHGHGQGHRSKESSSSSSKAKNSRPTSGPVMLEYQMSKSAPPTPVASRHTSAYTAMSASRSAAEHETLMASGSGSTTAIGGMSPLVSAKAGSTKSGTVGTMADDDDIPEGDRGVYDSSSKQRVPSW